MSIYVGMVEQRGTFYNFDPMYLYQDGQMTELSPEQISELIPGSEKQNINLQYMPSNYDQSDFMERYFLNGVPVVIDIVDGLLELNKMSDGSINKTAYKIKAYEAFNKGYFLDCNEINLFKLYRSNQIDADIKTATSIDLPDYYDIDCDQGVFIECKDEDMYVGPYHTAVTDENTYRAYSHFREKKYVLSGYTYGSCEVFYFSNDGENVYFMPNPGAKEKFIDVIDDANLLEEFKTSVNNKLLSNGKLDLSDIDALVESFEKSVFLSDISDTAIRKNRLYRVNEILNACDDTDDSFRAIAEELDDTLTTILHKYSDPDDANNFINSILDLNPNLLKDVSNYKVLSEKLEDLEGQLDQLQQLQEDAEVESQQIEGVSKEDVINSAEWKALEAERESVEKELNEKREELLKLHNLSDLDAELERSKLDNEVLSRQKDQLRRMTDSLSTELSKMTSNVEAKFAESFIDNYVANKLQEASSEWDRVSKIEKYTNRVNKYSEVVTSEMDQEELVDYLYESIGSVRSQYSKNTIINICISIVQNFLTVFSGEPGCGKTSICNIFGQALGLTKFDTEIEKGTARYVPVSVERGWTSKRDFIGYYNPLTKSFDENNRRVYESLQVLDIEEKSHIHLHPMIMLLDEANLSSMEYYWADFMNICDDLKASNEINVGDGSVFEIPETLRFVATINNDHTTETLSPRLIDRAGVVTLPKVSNVSFNDGVISGDKVQHVSWNSLNKTFNTTTVTEMNTLTAQIYKKIKALLGKKNIRLSARTEMAVAKYYTVAEKLMDKNSDPARREPSLIALDYAISQKVLPKVAGYGDDFREWLVEFKKIGDDYSLVETSAILEEIINKGDSNMKYYQFFA